MLHLTICGGTRFDANGCRSDKGLSVCVCARLCAGGEDDCFMVCVANSMETENLTLTMHASEHVPCQLVPKKSVAAMFELKFFS